MVVPVLVTLAALAVLLASHAFGRAQPTGDYRPPLPPDALGNGCYPLPGDARLDLPYQVRSDGDVTTDGGDQRRLLLGHYSVVDADEALARLVASFEAVGLHPVGPPRSAEGSGGPDGEVTEHLSQRLRGPGDAAAGPGSPTSTVVGIEVAPIAGTSPDTLVRGAFLLDLPVTERASDSAWCDLPASTKRWPEGGLAGGPLPGGAG